MNLEETARLLAFCAAYDNRKPSDAATLAWQKPLAWVDFADAEEAVADHYGRETEFIKPAHVTAIVKRMRRARAEGSEPGIPDADPDDVPSWIAALRSERHRDADTPRPRRFDAQALMTDRFRAIGAGPTARPANPCEARDCDEEAAAVVQRRVRGLALTNPRHFRLCAGHLSNARRALGQDRLEVIQSFGPVIEGEVAGSRPVLALPAGRVETSESRGGPSEESMAFARAEFARIQSETEAKATGNAS